MHKICSITGCFEKHRGKGFCLVHYRIYYRQNNQQKLQKDNKVYRENNKNRISKLKSIWYFNNKSHVINKVRNNPNTLKYKLNWLKKVGIMFNLNSYTYKMALQSWSETVRKRDNYICQICGIKSKNNVAHHILHKAKYPLLSLNINNGITLCLDNHKEVHGYA